MTPKTNPYKRLFSYVLPYWKTILLVLVCTIFVNGATLALPLLIRDLLNKVLLKKELFYLDIIVISVLVLVAVKGFFTYCQGYLMNFIGYSSVKKIREETFIKLQHLPMSFFETWKSGEIFSRLTNDVAVLTNIFSSTIVFLVNDTLVLIGALSWMFWKNPWLTLLIFSISPAIGFAVVKFGKWMNQVTAKTQAKIAELSHVMFEGILGIHVVKSYGREEKEIQKFKAKNEEYFTWSMKSTQVSFTQLPLVEFLTSIGIASVVYFGGYEVIQGKFTLGGMFAFWGYMVLATNPIFRLSSNITNLQRANAAAKRIFEILDSEEEPEIPNPVIPQEVHGEIKFSNVWFKYKPSENWALKEVNLSVKPGQIIAVVGPSGAGKTSLVELIPKFYKPTHGKITLDGVDISQIPSTLLRSYIGIVAQETFLFAGTVKENIAYGVSNPLFEEIIQAAKTANAHEFILKLKNGYDTVLGERGVNLSVGQRQRISIARAVLRNPKILILDEATSSVDTESEALIQEALERLMVGRTSFVIAHRLSTIRNANQIIAIQDGKIVQAGSHQDLLAQAGLYSRLYSAQSQVVEA